MTPTKSARARSRMRSVLTSRRIATPLRLMSRSSQPRRVEHPADFEWSVEHGYHTFIEKPLAATRAGLARALAVAGGNRHVALVACNLRFSDGYRVLRENLNAVGSIVSISADFGWYLPAWRPSDDYAMSYSARRDLGGGVILDAAIHELDYVLDLGGPVSSVSGLWTASQSLGIDVEDAAEMQLRHASGCISRIHVDYLRRTYTRRCTVVGTDGTLVWDFAAGSVTLACGPTRRRRAGYPWMATET